MNLFILKLHNTNGRADMRQMYYLLIEKHIEIGNS